MSELNTLLSQSTRDNVRNMLQTQIDTLRANTERLRKAEQDRLARLNNQNNTQQIVGTYTKKMYAIS